MMLDYDWSQLWRTQLQQTELNIYNQWFFVFIPFWHFLFYPFLPQLLPGTLLVSRVPASSLIRSSSHVNWTAIRQFFFMALLRCMHWKVRSSVTLPLFATKKHTYTSFVDEKTFECCLLFCPTVTVIQRTSMNHSQNCSSNNLCLTSSMLIQARLASLKAETCSRARKVIWESQNTQDI